VGKGSGLRDKNGVLGEITRRQVKQSPGGRPLTESATRKGRGDQKQPSVNNPSRENPHSSTVDEKPLLNSLTLPERPRKG